jgi:DNA polymerase-1
VIIASKQWIMHFDCILLDASALIYRSFYAVPDHFSTKKGEVTNAVYGFTNILIHVLKSYGPEYIAVGYDMKGKTLRHDSYEEYKATRVKAPDALYAQIPRTKDVLDAFGISYFEKEGYEADDVIGTLSSSFVRQFPGKKVLIISGDQDLFQLINNEVFVSTLKNGVKKMEIFNDNEVMQKLHIHANQVVDYKALVGDASDNIPGVPGVGPKTASSWLERYGSVDVLYQHLSELPERWNKTLSTNKDQAYLSQRLAQIYYDVPIDLTWESCVWKGAEEQNINAVFGELEFHSILGKAHALTKEYHEENRLLDEIREHEQNHKQPIDPTIQQSLF